MKSPNETIPVASDFHLSDPSLEGKQAFAAAGDFDLLPRAYGMPIVAALARNPTSLFVFWEIDWPALFQRIAPRHRTVYLRLQEPGGEEISSSVIEPMAGQCEVCVPRSNSNYRVELGYFGTDGVWHSAGSSDVVSMPSDSLSEETATTFATVPFHLSFQHLTDLLHASASANESVIEHLGRIQERALVPKEGEPLNSAEDEIFRAVDASLPNGWQDAAKNPGGEIDLEQRLEEILGFGSSSPANSLGGSSRV